MEKIFKIFFKNTLVLKGGYMRGPLYAPLVLAIPLIIVYSVIVLPVFPLIMAITIFNQIRKKEWPDKLEVLMFVVYGTVFLIWLRFVLKS